MIKKYFVVSTIILIISILLLFSGCASVEGLLEKGEFIKAIELCEKQEIDEQKEGYFKIAEAYFDKRNYEYAAEYYEKAKIENNEIAKECFIKLAEKYLKANQYNPIMIYSHDSRIMDLEISKNSKYLITSEFEGYVHLWNLINGTKLRKYGSSVYLGMDRKLIAYGNVPGSVSISSDNQYIAYSKQGDIVIYRIDNNLRVNSYRASGDLIYNVSIFQSLPLSLSKYTISIDSRLIRIDELLTGKDVTFYKHTNYRLKTFIVSNDNEYLLVNSTDDNLLHVILMKINKLDDSISLSNEKIFISDDNVADKIGFTKKSISLSLDNKYVIASNLSSSIPKIYIWNLETGELIKKIEGHSGFITSVAISSDNKYIISGSEDKTVKIWDFSDGKLIRTIEYKEVVWEVSISQNNKYFIVVAGEAAYAYYMFDTKNMAKKYFLKAGFTEEQIFEKTNK